jgi:Fe2+ transport system protein FeoA
MIVIINYNRCKLQGVAGVMTLDMAEPGQEYILRGIYGGCRLKRMLQERGLTEGVSIKVIKGGPGGPFIVEFRSSRIMLDRMCASKIVVTRGMEGPYEPVHECRVDGKCGRHRRGWGWRSWGRNGQGV